MAEAEAHSQQGQLQIEAGVDLSGEQAVFLPITIKGDGFRVANQPGFAVDISPEIEVRFANERTTSVNTTAVGGNASLLSLNDA